MSDKVFNVSIDTKTDAKPTPNHDKSQDIPLHLRAMQFTFALGGIYFCYLYYGIMQEYM